MGHSTPHGYKKWSDLWRLPYAKFYNRNRPIPDPHIQKLSHVRKTIFSFPDINTPFGFFKFVPMSFGLKNNEQSSQRLMNQILQDLNIFSNTEKVHLTLIINAKQCVFGVTKINNILYLKKYMQSKNSRFHQKQTNCNKF